MSTHHEKVALWLADKRLAMEAELAPLVEINSFTDSPPGGRKVGAGLRDLFALPGLGVTSVASEKFADHLVFTSNGDPNLRPLALVGHLDTVFPPGTFEGYRRDGDLARGPGVLDMKGGLVVVAYALRAVADVCGLDALPPLRIVVVADEEVGSPEGQRVIASAVTGADACLVFESGRKEDMIITRRKGTGAMTVIARGKAAHAGNNHKDGVNAILALSRFIVEAQALTDYDRGVTVNVGKVSGGQGKNTVPDYAEAALDIRFCTKVDADALVLAVQKAANIAAESVRGATVEVSGGLSRFPLERTAASAQLMSEYGECAKASGLGDKEAPLIGGGSDASTTSAMGIASIDGLGPRGLGFHTKDEFIEVSSLVPKAQALARFLVGRIGKSGGGEKP